MKRFHVHVGVSDLQKSRQFYSSLFGVPPSVVKDDYMKWMLDDPALNFAISTRAGTTGVDHLGLQTEDPAELEEMKQRAQAADESVRDEGLTTCCYARSEKHWITDPQGIAWEQYRSLEAIPVFNEPAVAGEGACCTPQPAGAAAGLRGMAVKSRSACC